MRISDWIHTCSLPICDLEADLGTRFGYQPARFLDELGIGEQLAGNIDRQHDIVSVARQPLLVLDHLSQRPQRERPDLARFLRHLDEVTGQDQPAGRVLPAHQRLGARDLLTAQMELGLILRSEEHTSELQSLMRISYAVFCLKKKTTSIE